MNASELNRHSIHFRKTIREAMAMLNEVPDTLTLFAVNEEGILLGTVTDGDIRRGLLRDVTLESAVEEIIYRNPRYIRDKDFSLDDIERFRQSRIKLVPILDQQHRIVRIIDLSRKKSVLPLEVVIMAGGRGERLRPLTDTTPKPMLLLGNKPILEHNIDRLIEFGINDFHLTTRYLSHQISDYFGNGSKKSIKIDYITEDQPLGTIGAVSLIKNLTSEHVLVMNSDVLTNIDYEDFYKTFLTEGADMAVASIPYKVNMPFAILETEGSRILSFREKPVFTHFANAGIYIIKRSLLNLVPEKKKFDATELMNDIIEKGLKMIHYPIIGYWTDIGRIEDFEKANKDIHHIRF